LFGIALISPVIETALRFPFRGDRSTEVLLVGGALVLAGALIYVVASLLAIFLIGLLLLPLVLVPQLLINGYLVRLLRASAQDADSVPPFDDWGRLLVDGVKIFAINLIYGFALLVVAVPLAVGLVFLNDESAAAAGAEAASGTIAADPSGLTLALTVGGGLVFLLAAVALLYLRALSIASFACAEDFTAAFSVDRIRRAGTSKRFAVGWLVAFVVRIVGEFVGALLMVFLVGFVIRFYTQAAVFSIYGRAVAEAFVPERA
jgi:hypothetical protein